MAGGNHTKSSSNKPSSSSSSSHRKSRWESNSSNNNNNNNHSHSHNHNHNHNPTSDPSKKPGDPKYSKAPSNPSPKPGPTPTDPNSGPGPGPIPFPDLSPLGPPPPPAYGFHMLERRTVVLADGSVRSYFALPSDYQDFTPPRPVDPTGRFLIGHGHGPGPGPELGGFEKRFLQGSPGGFNRHHDYWNSLGLDARGPGPGPSEGLMKRKYGGEEDEKDRRDEKDEFLKQRHHQFMQYANPNGFPVGPAGDRPDFLAGTSGFYGRSGGGDEFRASKYMRIGSGGDGGGDSVGHKHLEVDQNELKKAFLHFVKLVNENVNQRKIYLEDGKHGRLQCLVCGRSSKDFPDMHGLIMHAYNSDNADSRVDHLGLHKALCVLMGWSYSKPPDNSKTYQFLSADEAAANQDDLIMWPPLVIIHNTIAGKGKDGRMEGLGNKAMDNKIRDLGFGSGKSKSLYGRDGHLGITLVKFSGDPSGLKEAMRMAEFFDRENHGRKAWARVGQDDENNPNLVRLDEKTGEKKRIFYAYLGTAADLDKVDFDTRKKIVIESRREYKSK